MTGNRLHMQEFLSKATTRIPNLVGMKYTTSELHDYQQCMEMENRRFEVFWGVDEMLMSALAIGGDAAIGSTYNIAAPLYHRLIDAFSKGDLEAPRNHQYHAVEMISILLKYPFHGALKFIIKEQGIDAGSCRLPQRSLTDQEQTDLHRELEAVGFFQW